MKMPLQLRISDLLNKMAERANDVHIRLALSPMDGTVWVARSLIIDVFPDRWLDGSGEVFDAYRPPRALHDFQGQALFYLDMVETQIVRAWFAHPQDCSLSRFDPRSGYGTRVQSFRLPALFDDVPGLHVYSNQTDGFAILPWPHFHYNCMLKDQSVYRPSDFEPLYSPGQGHYDNFREARARLIHGVTDLERISYQDQDAVVFRFVDGDGWIRKIRVRGTRFEINVGGLGLHPGHIIAKPYGNEPIEKDVQKPGTVVLELSENPSQVDFILTNDSHELDRARYVRNPVPGMQTSTDHVVLDQESIGLPRPIDTLGSEVGQSRAEAQNDSARQLSTYPVDRVHAETLTSEKRILRVIVASPTDVQKERGSLQGVLDELNSGVGNLLGCELKLWRWETDAYPGFHVNGPQGMIDDMMRIEDADIVIGIFWMRFGTPVGDAESGTEHELRKAITAWEKQRHPQVMLYFSKQPIKNPDAEQLLALQRFKSSVKNKALLKDYRSKSEFPNVVRRDLSRLLQDHFAK